MPKRASGNVKEKGGTYEAFIPASWNHLKKRKTLGTFPTHEDAENAIELFRTTYVKDSGVLNSETFVAPNKLHRYTQESCRKSNGLFDCRDCGKEFENVKKRGGIRCPECFSKFASSYTSTSSITEERRQRIIEAKRRYYQRVRGTSNARLTSAVTLCPHGRQRYFCKECSTTEQILSRNIICHGCCDVYLSTQRKRNKITVCAECDPRVPQRTEKIVVPLLLSQIVHPVSAQDDTLFGGGECDASRRRPDLLWLYTDRVVTLEIDEHSHRDRTTSCELGKMHDQFVAWQALLGSVPVFYIRFNPDEYDGQRTLLDDRVSAVAQRVNELLTMDVTGYSSLVPHVEFFYYHSNAQHHIEGVRGAPDSFVLLRR